MLKSSCWWTSLSVEIGFLTQRQALALSDKSKDSTCKSHSPSDYPVSIPNPWGRESWWHGQLRRKKSSPLSYHFFSSWSQRNCVSDRRRAGKVLLRQNICWCGLWKMCLYEWENSGHPGVVTTGGRLDSTKHSHCCNRLDGTKLSYCCNRLVQTWASLPPGISSLTDVIQNIFSTWLLAMALPSTSDFCASQSTLWTDCCLRKFFLTYCTAVLVPRTLFALSNITCCPI